MLRAEIDDLEEKYETVLEALQYQTMVMDRLNGLLRDKMIHNGLSRDAATQTDILADESVSTFLTAAELRVRIFRTFTRKSAFAAASTMELEMLNASVDALRAEAADLVPAGDIVQRILSRPA
jgi:hypothetical protein